MNKISEYKNMLFIVLKALTGFSYKKNILYYFKL